MTMQASDTVIWQRDMAAMLVIQQGPEAGATFPLSAAEAVIGRESSSDIVLNDRVVSRRHARLSWRAGQLIIEDLGSSNGTYINNQRITAAKMLNPGDKIGVGQTTLVYQTEGVEFEESLLESTPPDATVIIKRPIIKKPVKHQGVIPARLILDTASRANQRLGHENLGFLSESHGFLPTRPPLLQLPAGYEPWDEMAGHLPELYRTLQVRQALGAMPLLSAKAEDLPDEYLLRASVILSILAHAYHRIDQDPPQEPLPECIQRPWEEISQRLHKPAPHLSYIDLIIYNWKLIDPDRADPMRVNNLELLVPTVDNKEERIFYLTQVEAHAQAAPLIGAAVRAHEAVVRDDVDALKQELMRFTDGLQHLTHKSFMTINPNPHSDTYTDPVIWAKTVAPFAVPIAKGTAGPSGTAAPIFHMLDMFFSRHHYDTRFGAEMLHLRDWYPKHWQDFLEALGEISVADYVAQRGDPRLQGIYKEAAQAYAGHSGFLYRHKLKAYGFLDIAFKVGRSVTITGFTGLFKDRTWDAVDSELLQARVERENDFPQAYHYADIKEVELSHLEGDPTKWVKRVTFDVSETGMRYLPGDRCAVLPENSEALIDQTLAALKAKGYETITLTAQWREAVKLRQGYEEATTLPIRTLLKFGRIRPVAREVAKSLYAISLDGKLRHIIQSRAEDQWELWDLLEMLNRAGFDPKRLWKAHPGQREHICRIVPPEMYRMYSISSTMDHASIEGASELTLTVGRLFYETRETEVSVKANRYGTASHFLGDTSPDSPEAHQNVSLRLVHPPRFGLPPEPGTPVVMFAGGTGVAPFRGFILERTRQKNAGDTWLFLAARTRSEFYYQEELEPIVATGRLQVRPAFSRDEVDTTFVSDSNGGGHFVFEPGEKRHIGDEILRAENATALWDLLRSQKDGGRGAYFYVCGQTGFATSVMAALKELIRRNSLGSEEEKQEFVNRTLYRLVGEERYMQDIFTTYTGSHIDQQQTYDASEIVRHNNEENGFWMVLNGRVYDLTEFAHLHAGGFKIISGYAGMDATIAYQKVLHHLNPEVDSMLGMYEIGVVRRLDFGMEWGVVLGPDGLRFMSLADAYRVWIRFLYNVVEMENALRNDFSLKEGALTYGESPESYSPLKLQFLLEVHDRFMLNYVEGTMGSTLENLWAVTSGICSPTQNVHWLRQTVTGIRSTQEANTVKRLSNELAARINDIVERQPGEDDPTVRLVKAYCTLLEAEDMRYLQEIKMALRAGLEVFEDYERDTIRLGRERLLEAVRQIPKLLESYHARVLSGALTILLARPE